MSRRQACVKLARRFRGAFVFCDLLDTIDERRQTVKIRMLCFVAVAALCGLAFTTSQAGEKKKDDKKDLLTAPKPGPEHKMLAKLAGKWNAKVKSWFGPGEPMESTGILDRKMIMGGLYLAEDFKGEFAKMKFQGQGLIGYDIRKKAYLMTWIDNFGTGISMNEGKYDESAKTYTFTGEEDNPEFGGKMKTRDVLQIVSNDEQKFEMYRTPLKTGKEHKVMEITYTRVAKKKKGD
jgi:hypothetical protein